MSGGTSGNSPIAPILKLWNHVIAEPREGRQLKSSIWQLERYPRQLDSPIFSFLVNGVSPLDGLDQAKPTLCGGHRTVISDKNLICVECSSPFTFIVGEEMFFASKPRRCPECRGFGGSPRDMYPAV